jgi:hypothetical protein
MRKILFSLTFATVLLGLASSGLGIFLFVIRMPGCRRALR